MRAPAARGPGVPEAVWDRVPDPAASARAPARGAVPGSGTDRAGWDPGPGSGREVRGRGADSSWMASGGRCTSSPLDYSPAYPSAARPLTRRRHGRRPGGGAGRGSHLPAAARPPRNRRPGGAPPPAATHPRREDSLVVLSGHAPAPRGQLLSWRSPALSALAPPPRRQPLAWRSPVLNGPGPSALAPPPRRPRPRRPDPAGGWTAPESAPRSGAGPGPWRPGRGRSHRCR